MIVVDTNVISELMKSDRHRAVEDWLDRQPGSGFYTASTSLAEIAFGVEKLPEGRRKTILRSIINEVFDRYFAGRILPFDETAARAYGRILAAARAKGRSILMADGQIASIAQANDLTVATRDTAPFEAAGIPVINPWDVP
ncbi:type II toxin-antitoxin system VapC family toxin [Rhizobium panacihumi]|uniref:type II toxin-antitoxin system VapC family toxin n=1 Tax=Rhizobium panacihumi TaxID=2008450 RepID=UPI003D7B809F